MTTKEALMANMDEIVASRKAVISGDNSVIIATVQEAIRSGRTVTFYVSREQGLAILRWYWTPGLIAKTGLKSVPDEEIAKIENELHVKVNGQCFSNYLECPNGHTYGAYEFIQQGIREHGPEFVKGAIEFKNTSIIRVNPSSWEVCPKCNLMIVSGGHYYSLGDGRYYCCRGKSIVDEP